MLVYPQAQPDYYQRTFTLQQYNQILSKIQHLKPGKYLYVGKNGLEIVGRIRMIWEAFKGMLGLYNGTQNFRVNFELLKFFHLGATHSYTSKATVQTSFQQIQDNIDRGNWLVTNQVQQALNLLRAKVTRTENDELDLITSLQGSLTSFSNTYHAHLGPSFWGKVVNEAVSCLGFDARVRMAHYEFGDTYMELAYKALQSVDTRHKFKALPHLISAAQLYNSGSDDYNNRLNLVFDNLLNSYSNYFGPTEIRHACKVQLLLATRAYLRKEYKTAAQRFEYVSNNQDLMTPFEFFAWFHSVLLNGDVKKAEQLFAEIDKNSEYYVDACLAFGEHYEKLKDAKSTAVKSWLSLGYSTSGNDYLGLASKYFTMATQAANSVPPIQLGQIAERLQNHHAGEVLRKTSEESGHVALKQNDFEKAAHWFYIALFCLPSEKLLAPEGNETLKQFIQVITSWQTTQKLDQKKCLELINNILLHLRPVKDFLSIQKDWYRNPADITSKVQSLLNQKGHFTVEVGARLHLIKADIMSNLKSFSPQEVLAEYELAMHLAPKNPFGSHALFTEDSQRKATDKIEVMIENARALAIAWNS